MKLKLIKVKDYLLLIDEEAEVKEGNYRVHIYEKTLNHPVHRLEHGENTFDTWKLVLAYYPLTKEAKELNLPLLTNPFYKKTDVVALAIEKYGDGYEAIDQIDAFKEGYKAAQQSNKQFSLDDIKKAFIAGLEFIPVDPNRYEEDADNYIQSLPTQQLPKEFVPELIQDYSNRSCQNCNLGQDGSCELKLEKECVAATGNEKHGDYWLSCLDDEEDAEIYKLKTITNSKGREELVGTWKF